MRQFRVHDKTDSADNLDRQDRQSKVGQVPRPFSAGVDEQAKNPNKKGHKQNAHRSRFVKTTTSGTATHQSRQRTDPCSNLDRIEKKVNGTARQCQPAKKHSDPAIGSASTSHIHLPNWLAIVRPQSAVSDYSPPPTPIAQ